MARHGRLGVVRTLARAHRSTAVRGGGGREDARRFEMGTPALPTIHTALGGQEIVDEVDRCVTALAAYEE